MILIVGRVWVRHEKTYLFSLALFVKYEVALFNSTHRHTHICKCVYICTHIYTFLWYQDEICNKDLD